MSDGYDFPCSHDETLKEHDLMFIDDGWTWAFNRMALHKIRRFGGLIGVFGGKVAMGAWVTYSVLESLGVEKITSTIKAN